MNIKYLTELKFSAIACISKTGGIGNKNKLLFHIKDDLKNFKERTENHIVVMGRKTFESIGKPLPNRFNIVLTSQPTEMYVEFKYNKWNNIITLNDKKDIPKVLTQSKINISSAICSFDIDVKLPKNIIKDRIFIIGGQSIYEQFEKYIDKYYLTIVDSEKEYDTYLPIFKEKIGKYNCIENLIKQDKEWLYIQKESKFDSENNLSYRELIMDKF